MSEDATRPPRSASNERAAPHQQRALGARWLKQPEPWVIRIQESVPEKGFLELKAQYSPI
jgi:hypothetical protein